MEDHKISIMNKTKHNTRSIQIKINTYTLIGATTRERLLKDPKLARYKNNYRLKYNDKDLLAMYINRSYVILGIEIQNDAASEIAGRSRGTPRIVNALLRRVRDFAQIKGNGSIDLKIAHLALSALNVDQHGLDEMDNRLLTTIIDKFKGGPVG